MKRRSSSETAESKLAPRILRTDEVATGALDSNAVHVVDRLQRFGHEAYLVGGCVRDLLLKRAPKDFDVATSARPRQIRRVFRNCRIIGRRFKLAHVVFGDDIVETSTFRTIPSEQPRALGDDSDRDLLIVSDNEFGTAVEDAQRRDFTVNALFYDPSKREVIDHVGGLADLKARLIRTVGDPQIRFREDPVRILRAIKFASRLDFEFEPETFRAMLDCAGDLQKGSPPRILEEILRLLRSGRAQSAFRLLDATHALDVILPEIATYLRESRAAEDDGDRIFFAYLDELDRRFDEGDDPSAGFCLAVLFERLLQRDLQRRAAQSRVPMDLLVILDEVMADFAERTRLSRKDSGIARRIALHKHRLERRGRRRPKPTALLRQEGFDEALDLIAIEAAVTGSSEAAELFSEWNERRLALASEGGLDNSDPTRRKHILHGPDPLLRLKARTKVERSASSSTRAEPEVATPSPTREALHPAPRAAELPPKLRVSVHREPRSKSAAEAPVVPSSKSEPLDDLPFGHGIFDATPERNATPRRTPRKRR